VHLFFWHKKKKKPTRGLSSPAGSVNRHSTSERDSSASWIYREEFTGDSLSYIIESRWRRARKNDESTCGASIAFMGGEGVYTWYPEPWIKKYTLLYFNDPSRYTRTIKYLDLYAPILSSFGRISSLSPSPSPSLFLSERGKDRTFPLMLNIRDYLARNWLRWNREISLRKD